MKIYHRIYIVVMFGIIAFFGMYSLLAPQKRFSENENRYLEQYPKVKAKEVLSGEFQEEFEEAFSDQFLGRDIWMLSTTAVERAAGLRELNGIYFGKDDYYLEKKTQEDIDEKRYLQNLRYVEYLGEQQMNKVSLLLAPSPGTILKNKLPAGAPYYSAKAMYRMANTVLKRALLIDSRAQLREYGEQNQVYYRTDHHWTTLGAYAAYSVYRDENDMDKHTYGYFAIQKVSEDFLGTMYSQVMAVGAVKDTVYAVSNIPQAEIICDGENKSSIYDVEKLTQKDKYAYFFGGNYGEVRINMNNGTSKKLLVIKDSYANCFVPFLMEDYDSITMIDLRYYKQSVQALLSEDTYDDILVLYEMSNFAQDSNLYKLVY